MWVSRPHWVVVRAQLRERNRNRPAAGQDQSYLYITSTPTQPASTQQHSEAAPHQPLHWALHFLGSGNLLPDHFSTCTRCKKHAVLARTGCRNMQLEVWCKLMQITQTCKPSTVLVLKNIRHFRRHEQDVTSYCSLVMTSDIRLTLTVPACPCSLLTSKWLKGSNKNQVTGSN